MVSREPVVAGIVGLDVAVAAVLSAAVALGWLSLSAEQVAAIVGAVAAVSALIAGVVRARVTPVGQFGTIDETFSVGVWAGLVEAGADDGPGAGNVD